MIICYVCMFFSIILLSLTGIQGYFNFHIMNASYQEFALFSTTFYMFSQTLIMFYFIGSGTAIKKEIVQNEIKTSLYEKIKKTKMILFPHLTLNMFLIGTAFILIGAVDTGSVTKLVQSSLFVISYLHFIYIIMIQHTGFKENIDIIIELADMNNVNSLAN